MTLARLSLPCQSYSLCLEGPLACVLYRLPCSDFLYKHMIKELILIFSFFFSILHNIIVGTVYLSSFEIHIPSQMLASKGVA